jgi:hypothetical protein
MTAVGLFVGQMFVLLLLPALLPIRQCVADACLRKPPKVVKAP